MGNILIAALTSLGLFILQVQAADPICADACLTLATNYVYDDCSLLDENYYACRCISPEFLGTLALCIQEHCDTSEWEWIDMDICQGYGETGQIASYETVIANATEFAADPPENATLSLTNPLKFPRSVFGQAFETSADFIGNMTDASFFGYPPLSTVRFKDRWLLCMFAGILCTY